MLSAFLLSSVEIHAAQILTATGDATLSAVISRTEPTLIRIEGQPIRRVFGSRGEFTVDADETNGDAYIRPTTDQKTISVFVSDHSGNTIKLLLAIENAPSETIIIKGVKAKGKAASSGQLFGKETPRVQAIKRMVVALESSDSLGLDAQVKNEIVPLWNEARFVLRKVVDGTAVKGYRYSLTNLTKQPMVIDEREFYRRGVLAVTVDRPTLLAGETTSVFVVAEAENE